MSESEDNLSVKDFAEIFVVFSGIVFTYLITKDIYNNKAFVGASTEYVSNLYSFFVGTDAGHVILLAFLIGMMLQKRFFGGDKNE